MKKLKIRILLLSAFILSFLMMSSAQMMNVAATEYTINVGDEWTYDININGSTILNLGIEVTFVPEPDTPAPPLGTFYYDYVAGPTDQPLNTSSPYVPILPLVMTDDEVMLYMTNPDAVIAPLTYGEITSICIIIDDPITAMAKIVIDMTTGIQLEYFDYTSGMQQILISWSVSGTPPPPPVYTVEVGEEWTYDNQTYDGTHTSFLGIEVTSVPASPDPPLGTMYEDYVAGPTNLPLNLGFVLTDAQIAMALATMGGYIETRIYGERSCECVVVEMGPDLMVIDNTTGILLESRNFGADVHQVLISWSVSAPPPPLISINSPSDYDTFDTVAPDYEIFIEEDSIADVWYTLNDGNPIDLLDVNGSQSDTINQTAWDLLDEDLITITFYANNTGGSIGSEQVVVTKDTTDPVIEITTPGEGDTIGAVAPDYDITITELNMENAWYTINGGDPILLSIDNGSQSGTIDQGEWDLLGNGDITIRFYATDSAGNEGSEEVIVTKFVVPDTIDPILAIMAPGEGDTIGADAPAYDIIIAELNMENAWYTINGGVPISLSGVAGQQTGTIDQTAWGLLGDGLVTITFYANDTEGNEGSAQVNVTKDTTDPVIEITTPGEDDTIGADAPAYDITITELNMENAWYTLNGGVPISLSGIAGQQTGTIDQTAWDLLGNGNIIICFHAIDAAGNNVSKEVTVVKSVDSTTPGFNILDFLMSPLGMIIMVGSIGGLVVATIGVAKTRSKKRVKKNR